jgi:propionyl-CoA synthetase
LLEHSGPKVARLVFNLRRQQLARMVSNDDGFRGSYLAEFPGYHKTAGAGFKDEDGSLFVMGRTDDIINVAGHRLSTGGMKENPAAHPGF